jgi:transcription-repair coupling factor (superfamily II helicase)
VDPRRDLRQFAVTVTDSIPLFARLPVPEGVHKRAGWARPHGSALALALAELARAQAALIAVVVRDTHAAHTLEGELRAFLGHAAPVLHVPDWETLPYDLFSPHPDIVSQRIATLYRLPGVRRGVLVIPIATLMQRLAPREFILGSNLELAVGDVLDLESERRRLDGAGYRHVPQVLEPGDYATRGALIDIFPMGAGEPYRVELFDDRIETIRSFDPETQRSQARIERVQLLSAREFPVNDAAARRFRNLLRERFDLDPRRCPIYQDMREGATPAGIEYYLPLFFDHTDSLFDYLGGETLFVLDHGALDASDAFWATTADRFEQRRHDVERPVLAPAEIYLTPQQLREQLNRGRRIEIAPAGDALEVRAIGTQPAPMLSLATRDAEPAAELKRFLAAYPGRVLIASDSPGRREALLEQLRAVDIAPTVIADWQAFTAGTERLAIAALPIEDGFALDAAGLCVLTERQLYGERAQQARRRRRAARDPEAIIRELGELALGAPVVHADHGVGRYRGLIKLEVGGAPGEFLALEYARGDKLYVPVSQLDLVSRYTGTTPELAPLHSLGGDAWEKAKRKAAEKVRDVAAELLELYARREARGGRAIAVDRGMYTQFAAGFPFEETPDQADAIAAVLDDIAKGRAMDRVVCGDVGFGKTEVAMRAAFAVAQSGRQVALLVPTTLLAQQHYNNFRDRFADWPIRIEVLSRFKSRKETDDALARIADGRIDIAIGTHRLIQPDVRFKDLGLVIVDEEHRFGVRQKEQLKKLRAEVDLLTLTATPIPRTLNMSMAGLRDLSIIATPPAHRLAVQTFVTPWDSAQLREAVQRELARGGQVYFLHNEVETIERMARELGTLVPEARIRIAHGQMPERELEQVMLDFYRQRFNLLVCTTIIESGIDVPSANTIIIHRADRFGLAQLHQLRGRVGRSHHRAYAYLVVPDKRSLSADAEKRLEAIASLEELGAGFALATHDLEIRGAGELLGEEQSGEIQQVGFSLYTELLERAVQALKEGKLPDVDLDARRHCEVDLHLPALIPDDYLDDVHTRLVLYKRIAIAPREEELTELSVELVDRFGPLPEPTKTLFAIARLKQRAAALGIRKLDLGAQGGRVLFEPKPAIDPLTVIRMIQAQPRVYALDGQDKLKVRLDLPGAAERLRCASELLTALAQKPAAPAQARTRERA